MEACWDKDSAHARFWKRLITDRAVSYMRDANYMKRLRYEPDLAAGLQKRFGAVWADYGTDVFKLIAEAHNEKWDSEDEEKSAFARVQAQKKEIPINQRDDNLAATRETGALEWINEFQGIVEESLSIVEEEKGRRSGLIRCIGGAEEKKARAQEEESGGGGRREDFYRRAGGTQR